MLIVNEIFASIDGEGKRTGKPATFIRLAGCNLRCVYCDTAYALRCDRGTKMTIQQIVEKCRQLGYHRITMTGGEPLLQEGSVALLLRLARDGFQVNVETNGSMDLTALINIRQRENLNYFFTVDYKSLYSGQNSYNNIDSFRWLDPEKDIVKCVVANEADMQNALDYLDHFKKRFDIWFSPVFGKIDPVDIVKFVQRTKREDITVQVQLHKIIWDPNMRGV